MSIPLLFARRKTSFSPEMLFAGGENGAWYDPSDFSTMFQDSAGTTPVTAVEQPVGFILDKSKARQTGSELITNGTFDTTIAPWITISGSLTITWESGAARVTGAAGVGVIRPNNNVNFITSGNLYLVSFDLIQNQITSGLLGIRTTAAINNGVAQILISSSTTPGTKTFYLAGAGNGSVEIKDFTCIGSILIDNFSVKRVTNNHGFQGPTASRPILRQEIGGQYYLAFDGIDDWLQTANIDFSAANKMSVFAGIRKLSDATQGVVAELSATIASNNGTFLLSAPGSAAANYSFSSKGTSQVDNTITTYAAPITNVITGLADIAAPINTIRVNQVATTLNTSQGTGNFGNYPLYIGRRGGTTLPFNGRLYSLIIRGALTSSPQLEQTERWVAAKTGVTL